ncbi:MULTISPECIES: hypothetical protein [Mycobacterium avium complex (MAC)]|jgi:hypothetical protein|uniref:Uncharacterized protein n=2 Tax=Mycobacterium avium complex (MAC) TaxID=120793 RepID=A0AAW5S9N1_MYCBC|nr:MULTISPECIES: hypothetical protein [Mycobacterium avium complex (MAC)]ETA95294.1 hypothetical protein O984_03000 [Mycobacterium avium 05-4293]ETB16200.1 hypothetical protein O972_13510 [Mycobacterium avium subsp. avium 10-9275]ETB20644.1 hypothetical protein O973_12970 [Mycobacterium avium subsp. avium 11-4751]ETB39740.1 hypothetical protein N602_14510 [Mycobacterium avium subsp. hominissuis 10-5606]EUA36708.1 hypothetical protein I549_3310 [Mycobacterium avium subsp. avium 2285 (R)]
MSATMRSEVHMDDPLDGMVRAMPEQLNAGFLRVRIYCPRGAPAGDGLLHPAHGEAPA